MANSCKRLYPIIQLINKMQILWRKTSELFWQYPVLWLPILIADTLQSFLHWLQKLSIRGILTSSLQSSRSVLGGPPDLTADPTVSAKAALGAGIVRTGIELFIVSLYIAAMLVTARLVKDCLGNKNPEFLTAVRSTLQSAKRRILILSIKVGFSFAAGSILFVLLLTHIPRVRAFSYGDIGYGFGVVLIAAIAYLLTLAAITAIQPLQPISPKDLANARLLAILGVVASSIIGLFAQRAAASFAADYPSVFTQQLIDLIASFFTALPYVPLSIALALVAWGLNTYPEEIGITE